MLALAERNHKALFWNWIESKLETYDDPLPQKADAVLAVGIDVAKRGFKPSPQSAAVAHMASNIFLDGKAKNIVISGGYSNGFITEAAAMLHVVPYTVPMEKVVLEMESDHRTWLNADYILQIFKQKGWKSTIIVAQQWHARRVRATFKKRWKDSGINFCVVKARSCYGGGSQWRLRHFLTFLVWDMLSFIYSKIRGHA